MYSTTITVLNQKHGNAIENMRKETKEIENFIMYENKSFIIYLKL